MMMEKFIVYMATNIVNGKRYIGMTKHSLDFRKRQHLSAIRRGNNGCPIFSAAIIKYGEDAFEWAITATFLDRATAITEEVRLIADLKPEYNVTRGGEGASYPRSAETKARTSRSLMGHSVSPETRAKLTGRKHSPATVERLRELGHERKELFMQFQGLGPLAARRKVVCLNTGKIYESAKAAALANGISKSLMIEVCLRNPRRKTAKGLVFRYLGDHHGGVEEANKMLTERDAGRKIGGQACAKPVRCDTYGLCFSGAAAAANEFCISRGAINEVCRGEKANTFGLKFSYIGER